MKNTLLTIIFAFCFLAPVSGQIAAIKPTTPEQSGDENAAAGKYAAAIDQYKTAWLGWFIGRNEADADLRSAHERLAGKMGTTLAKMTSPPVPSEDADFHAQKGAAFVKLAKTPLDFLKAASQFQEAVNGAPWVFDYHFNLAVAYKSAGQFKDALYALSLAKLLTANEKDRRDANALRAEIEAAQEIAAPAVQAEREKQKLAEMIKALDGVVFVAPWKVYSNGSRFRWKSKIVGQQMVVGVERIEESGSISDPERIYGEQFSYASNHDAKVYDINSLDMIMTKPAGCWNGRQTVEIPRTIKIDLELPAITVVVCDDTYVMKRQ
ncbi:MAG: hypothetical protein IPI64_05795 [Chloracidobacterium sp.]|nr:hypothetical protein [Chloracidobacterium sp.]